MIPAHDPVTHCLPLGIHLADSWNEVEKRFGYSDDRKNKLKKLANAIWILRDDFKCKRIFLDGSFIKENHPLPRDYDVVWDDTGIDLLACRKICFTFFKFENKRALQKKEFGGEFFPLSFINGDNGKTFLDTFQEDDRLEPTLKKGIVEIYL